jgi:hypothetical protein
MQTDPRPPSGAGAYRAPTMGETIDYSPVNVYVPTAERMALTSIEPGAGIVGTPQPDGGLCLDYEGDTHRGRLTGTWADRLHTAWGRHLPQDGHRYPTLARDEQPTELFVTVGRYDPREGDVELVDEPGVYDLVAQWLGLPLDDASHGAIAEQLRTTDDVHHMQRREIRAALAAHRIPRQVIAQHARRLGHDDIVV